MLAPSGALAAQPLNETPAPTDARDYAGMTEVSSDTSAESPADDGPEDPPAATEASEPAQSAEDEVVVESGTDLFEQGMANTAATGDEGSVQEAAAERGWGFDLGGYVRGDMFIGKVPDFRQGEIKATYGELSLQAEVARERYGKAHAEARIRYGQQGEAQALFVDLREAYVDLFVGPVDLRLGNQIIVWGRADAFNPTNNLTPIDWRIRSPIEDDRRVANVGARMFLNFMPVRIEGVWMPLYSPIEYPRFPPIEHIEITDPDFPQPFLNNGLYAGRFHLELAQFEMSTSYLYGPALLPGLALVDYTVGVDPTVIRVARTAYDHHVAGLDFSTAIGDLFAIRGEAAFRYPPGYEDEVHAARPDVQYVLGIDRAFGPVTVLGQYMGRFVFDWQKEDGPEIPVDPDELSTWEPPLPPTTREQVEAQLGEELAQRNQILFSQLARVQHLASSRIEWSTLHDTLSLSALGMVNFTTWEWLLYPKIGYQISDHMSAYVGGQIYVGPDDTLLGWIDEILSAGYAELRFSF